MGCAWNFSIHLYLLFHLSATTDTCKTNPVFCFISRSLFLQCSPLWNLQAKHRLCTHIHIHIHLLNPRQGVVFWDFLMYLCIWLLLNNTLLFVIFTVYAWWEMEWSENNKSGAVLKNMRITTSSADNSGYFISFRAEQEWRQVTGDGFLKNICFSLRWLWFCGILQQQQQKDRLFTIIIKGSQRGLNRITALFNTCFRLLLVLY